jgi:hypothetical protein
VRGVGMVTLTPQDVVRHSLVQRVIEAYGEEEAAEGQRDKGTQGQGERGAEGRGDEVPLPRAEVEP